MMRGYLLAVLAASCAAMAWLNIHWWQDPPDLSPIQPDRALNLSDTEANAGATAQLDAAAALAPVESLLRPLFHSTRRPFVPPPVQVEETAVVEDLPQEEIEPEPAVPQAMPDLRLAGISLSMNKSRALIGRTDGSDFRWYGRGEEISGWTVTSITNLAVTLESGGQNFTVSLYPAAASSGIPQ